MQRPTGSQAVALQNAQVIAAHPRYGARSKKSQHVEGEPATVQQARMQPMGASRRWRAGGNPRQRFLAHACHRPCSGGHRPQAAQARPLCRQVCQPGDQRVWRGSSAGENPAGECAPALQRQPAAISFQTSRLSPPAACRRLTRAPMPAALQWRWPLPTCTSAPRQAGRACLPPLMYMMDLPRHPVLKCRVSPPPAGLQLIKTMKNALVKQTREAVKRVAPPQRARLGTRGGQRQQAAAVAAAAAGGAAGAGDDGGGQDAGGCLACQHALSAFPVPKQTCRTAV